MIVVVVQSLSHVRLFVTPWTRACQASLSFIISWSLLKFMSINLVMPSNHLNLCRFLFLLPSIFPSIRVFPVSWLFTSVGQSIGASVSAALLPMNIQTWFALGWTGFISLLSRGLSRVLQHHNLKASILERSAFFTVQLSRPYKATGNTIAVTRWTWQQSEVSAF